MMSEKYQNQRCILSIKRNFDRNSIFELDFPELEEIFLYCLASTAKKYDISIHGFAVSYDVWFGLVSGRCESCSKFVTLFHQSIAKCTKSKLIHSQSIWSEKRPETVKLFSQKEIVQALVRIADSPVIGSIDPLTQEKLFIRVLPFNVRPRYQKCQRPQEHFRDNGPMPEYVDFTEIFQNKIPHRNMKNIREKLEAKLKQPLKFVQLTRVHPSELEPSDMQ